MRTPQGEDSSVYIGFAESFERAFRATVIPPEQRERYRRETSLRDFYEEWLDPLHRQRVADGTLAQGTYDRYRQAISVWERHAPRPADWPAGRTWPGLPIGLASDRYVTEFRRAAIAAPLSIDYVKSIWFHLRAVFNHAKKLRAIETTPVPEPLDPPQIETRVYSDEEIEAIYRGLATLPALQSAFVLSCNAGPRTADLFLLRWEKTDLGSNVPSIAFTSEKTGKAQRIPLAPCTAAHVARLARGKLLAEGPLFPGLTSPQAKDPERSRRARARNSMMMTVLRANGIEDVDKPWQVGHATCNTRYNTEKPGVGDFILGHGLQGVNAKHYWQPTQAVLHGVRDLPQPACFLEILQAG